MSFFSELHRRNVVKVVTAYVVTSWLVVQVAETVLPAFEIADTAIRYVIIVLSIGAIPVAIVAWIFELTPGGVRFESDVQPGDSIAATTARKLNFLIILVLTVAVIYFSADRFLFEPSRIETEIESARLEGRAQVLSRRFVDSSIAVMPFIDLSATNDQEYFSDGLAEELLNLLAQVPNLRVVSRTSSFSFKNKNVTTSEIVSKLNVTHVLEGSVRLSGDKIRITAQLIEGATDSHVWSKTWDRSMTDVFSIQDEIANSVVENLVDAISRAPLRADATHPEAFAAYMQGRHLARNSTAESLSSAADLYNKAIEIDPEYEPAWSSLANVYINQSSRNLIPREDGYRLAREAAIQALSINTDSASAYEKLGWIAMNFDNDLAAAARYYERALKLAPSNSGLLGNAAGLAMKLGQMDEAIELAQFAASREPVSAVWQYNLGVMQYYNGQFDSAENSINSALTLSPGYLRANYILSLALLLNGKIDEAFEAIKNEPLDDYRVVALPLIHFALANADDASASLTQLINDRQSDAAYNIAGVFAFRGESDTAFEWLRRALDNSDSGLWLSAYDPLLYDLHNDQRWEAYIRDVDKYLGRQADEIAEIDFNVSLPNAN